MIRRTFELFETQMSHDWIWDFVINLNPRILLIAILKDLEDMNYYLFWFEVRRLECTTEWSALPQCVSAHSDFLRWQIKCQSVLFSNAHLYVGATCAVWFRLTPQHLTSNGILNSNTTLVELCISHFYLSDNKNPMRKMKMA